MNEVADFWRTYRNNEIPNVAWVQSNCNITDIFTRDRNNILLETMRTSNTKFIIEQCVCKDNE